MSTRHVLDALDGVIARHQCLVSTHLFGGFELGGEVSTATTVAAPLSAFSTWIAIWPRPPVPITTAVDPGPSRWIERFTA